MKRAVVWQRVDTVGVEYAEIALDPIAIDGEVIVVEGGLPCAVSYRVECDVAGRTLLASVQVKRNGERLERRLERSDRKAWRIDGIPAPRFDGLVDVDLAFTPSTNMPPLRRLCLAEGQRAEVTAVWLTFPALEVAPLRQVYSRLSATTYGYEAIDLGFRGEIECDEDGLALTYAGLWRRAPARMS